MSEIVRWYLVECTRRSVEPYYGFVEHIHDGIIRCDIDFAPLPSLRLLIGAMNALQPDAPRRAYGLTGSASAVALVQLRELSLSLGVNKHALHPPKNSQQLKSFAALSARHKHLTSTTLLSTASTSTTGAPVSLVHRLVSGLVACARRYTSDLQVLRIRGIALRLPEAAQKGTPPAAASRLDSSHVPLHRFCQTLGSCVRLTTVDVSDTNIGDTAAVVLLTAISPLPLLREVYLSGCDMTDTAADALVLLVTSSQQKHAAHAFQTSLRSSEERGPMSDRPSAGLVHLDVSRNTLGDGAANKIAAALLHDMSLQTLALHDNAVTAAGCRRLMMAVAEPGAARQLRFLNMSQQGLDATALGPSITEASRSFSVCCESLGQLILSRALHPNVAAVSIEAPLRPPPATSTRSRSTGATSPFDVLQHEGTRPASATIPPLSVSPTDGTTHTRQDRLVGRRASTGSPVLDNDLSTRGHDDEPRRFVGAGAPRVSMSRGTSPAPPQGDAHARHSTLPAVDEPHAEVGQASSVPPPTSARDAGCPPWPNIVQMHPSAVAGSSVLAIPVLTWPLPFPPWGTGGIAPPPQAPWYSFPQPPPSTCVERAQAATQTPEWEANELALLQSAKPLTVADLLDPLHTESPQVSAAGCAPQDAEANADREAETAEAAPFVLEDDKNATAIVARVASGELALASLAAALEATDGRLSADINVLKLDARMTKQHLQELSESVYSALHTVQGTARQLADERKLFADAERAREAWLEAHPEELMERDVVELIQMGIDRIRTQMRIDNDSPVPLSAVKQGGAAVAPALRPLSSASTKAVSIQPTQSESSSASNLETLSAFTDAVKRKLDALGWNST